MPWLDYLLGVDWTSAGKVVLSSLVGAGLGSAAVQGLFKVWGERSRRTAQATYLAMRLAVLLDAFGLACSDMITRNANAEPPPGEEHPHWEPFPELPSYPEDSEGWVALHRALAIRCLRLRTSIHSSKGVLRGTAEYSEDDLGDAINQQAAWLGLQARGIADDLHRGYDLQSAGGEYASSLEEVWNQATKAMQDRRQRQVESRVRRQRAAERASPS